MEMSSIRAIKDGNVVRICQCLFVLKAKTQQVFDILLYYCHYLGGFCQLKKTNDVITIACDGGSL